MSTTPTAPVTTVQVTELERLIAAIEACNQSLSGLGDRVIQALAQSSSSSD